MWESTGWGVAHKAVLPGLACRQAMDVGSRESALGGEQHAGQQGRHHTSSFLWKESDILAW